MFFSFKEIVCVEKEGVLKRIWPKKDKKKIKFGEKNECKALQIFKIWYTISKLSANVFLKQSLKQYKEVE